MVLIEGLYFRKTLEDRSCIVFVFTYQIDRVKHLNFSYRGTAGVGKVTVIITDGKGTQSWRDTNRKQFTKVVKILNFC